MAALDETNPTPPPLTPAEYLEGCKATESPPTDAVITRLAILVRDLHGLLGAVTEVGELADAFKKHIYYGKELDRANIKEELGDLSWYTSILIDANGTTWEEVWDANQQKLRKVRYKNGFTAQDAINRDLAAERKVFDK